MGCTQRQTYHMSIQEFALRAQAHDRSERAEWQRTLAIVNQIRGALGVDPVSMDALETGAQPAGRSDREAYEALKGRHIDWITDTSA